MSRRTPRLGQSTFGSPFSKYAKVIVPEAKNFYFGRGPAPSYLGVEALDLKLLKRNKGGFALNRSDRGLDPIPLKDLKPTPGPGAYDHQALSMLRRSFQRNDRRKNTFGVGDRDVSFAKYSEINESIYTKGLV